MQFPFTAISLACQLVDLKCGARKLLAILTATAVMLGTFPAAAEEVGWLSDAPTQLQWPAPSQRVPVAAGSVEDRIVQEPVPWDDGAMELPSIAEQPLLAEEPVEEQRWPGYAATRSGSSWNIAGRDLSIFSLQCHGNLCGIENRIGWHFLSGPVHTDMPSQLLDFELACRRRYDWAESTFLDLRVSVGAYGDFQGSVREGIRFPGHAIVYHDLTPTLMTAAGVEVLDRDDLLALPVVGLVWQPSDQWTVEMVFPRPRVEWCCCARFAVYVAGELGGGTWAIERMDFSPDVATYRDLRVVLGIMDFEAESSVIEIGYSFARRLEYRSGMGDTELSDGILLQCRTAY